MFHSQGFTLKVSLSRFQYQGFTLKVTDYSETLSLLYIVSVWYSYLYVSQCMV